MACGRDNLNILIVSCSIFFLYGADNQFSNNSIMAHAIVKCGVVNK